MLWPTCLFTWESSGDCYGFRVIIQYLLRFAYVVRCERKGLPVKTLSLVHMFTKTKHFSENFLNRIVSGKNIEKKTPDCLTDVRLFFFYFGKPPAIINLSHDNFLMLNLPA